MLAPEAESAMFRAALRVMEPVPLAASLLVALGRLIAPAMDEAAVEVRLLLSAIVTDWLNVMPAPLVSARSEAGVSALLTVIAPLLLSPTWSDPVVIRSNSAL